MGDFPGSLVTDSSLPVREGGEVGGGSPVSIPGPGSRSLILQKRSKILCATTKTWCSQINEKKS